MEQQNTFNPGLAYSDYKQLQVVYIVAALTAYFLSAYFVVGYFAGHLRILEWDGAQWAQAFPSAGLVAVMTAYQFFLYSNGDTEGGKKATWIAVAVAVAFSLLSEIGQGMERDSIRMETKSQESPTYKAAVSALGNLSGGNVGASPYAADIAKAQVKLADCQEKLRRGVVENCIHSNANLASMQQQEAAWSDRASTTSTNTATTLLDKAKAMEKDERNYHPLVNAFREFFGVSGTIGSFMLSLTLISFFEYAFHYLGGRYAKARAKLMHNGYDVTRKLRQPPRKHDGSVTTYSNGNNALPLTALDSAKMTVGEYAAKVEEGLKASPEVIATEYARAQHAREQVYQKAADKLDSIQDGLNQKADLSRERFFRLMYMEARARILNGAMQPTLENVQQCVVDTIKHHTKALGLQPALIAEPEQRKIAKTILVNLEKDGIINNGQLAAKWQPSNRTAPEIIEADGFKQSPAQLAKVKELHSQQLRDNANGKTYREELRSGERVFSDTPLDMPRPAPRLSVEQTVKQIQADVKASGANSPDAIRAAVFNSFAAMQNPAPLDDAVLDKLADKLVIKQVHAPARPFHQQQGATGLQNPALGTAEEHYPLPLSATTPDYPKGSGTTPATTTPDYPKGSGTTPATTTPDYPKGSGTTPAATTPDYPKGSEAAMKGLYAEWLEAVAAQGIKPASEPFNLFVFERTNVKGLGKDRLKVVWDEFCQRACNDGVLKLNPDYQEGNRKAKYILV